ncbi:MAG: NAD-dependent epimerase/dehydratase family protein, partial [Acetobacteraceae bacterium]|nr:NAD-dependent epimerase/dehydratase family protein [Acetobacteraceae bacterium]
MKRVLVTGPSGFIGQHCLRRLITEDCEIHAANRRGISAAGPRVQWHAADLCDPASNRALIEAVRPTHVLHLAWEATPRLYNQSPENFKWLCAGIEMATAFGEIGGTRFVGVGTSAEYQASLTPCQEDTTPIQPATVYGKTKASFAYALDGLSQHFKFSSAWARIFLPYGPGDPPQRLIPSVIASLDARRPVETTHGRQLRDFIYVTDVADCLVTLLFASEDGAFNVGTGVQTQIRSVIQHLADRCDGSAWLRFGAIKPP